MYEVTQDEDGFVIIDENGHTVAVARVEADAKEIVAALNLVEVALECFPGLRADEVDGDGYLVERPVNGADLVDLFVERIVVDGEGRFSERP
jgi:hypothetical protein